MMGKTADGTPDINDLYACAADVTRLTLELELKEIDLAEAVSELAEDYTTNPNKFKPTGKPHSMAYLEKTVLLTGENGEIATIRRDIAELKSNLLGEKMRMDVMKMDIDLYRTQAANKRKAG